MTILPKKKQNKNTNSNDDERENDITSDLYAYAGGQSVSQIASSGRPWATRSDDKRSAPDNGPSHSKRRHRSTLVERENLINSVIGLNNSSLNSPSNSTRASPDNISDLPCDSKENNQMSGTLLVDYNNDSHYNNANNEDFSGYNSGDEYQKPIEHMVSNDWEEKERTFERMINKKGFNIKKMCEDGACLFRAVADQVYGDQEMHSLVRKLCMDYMEKNCDYFSQYVTENFSDYIQRKRSDHIHGNHVELQALSELFARPIQIYHYSSEPIHIDNCKKDTNEPIRLSYHRNIHYNSIVNPYKPTISVDLSLPSFKTDITEKTLVEKAILISEQHELEQAMLEDKIRATDWEATNEAIEEQIARQSYIEWIRENELRSRTKSSATSTLTNNDDESNLNHSPKCYSPRSSKSCSSPNRCNINNSINENKPRSSTLLTNINSNSNFIREVPPSVLGLNDWDDSDPIMAQVLAQSQAEYIDSLKERISGERSNETSDNTNSSDFIPLPSTSSKRF